MPELIPVLRAVEIDRRVKALAERISADYQGRKLILIAVLKGAFVFLADLVRHLDIPVKIDFLHASSYGSGTDSSGRIRCAKDPEMDIRDRDVLLVEDIVDTGNTLRWILNQLSSLQPRSLRVCALVDKRERREGEVTIDYCGHVTGEGFLVGYGMDYAEDYRHLPDIFRLEMP
jgi:hypoxanthine phosphoribosyltransferase